MRWFHSDFPPYFIQSGPYKGQGTGDQVETFIMQALPGFEHRVSSANTARRQEAIRNGMLVCSSAILRTPQREQYMVFSEAYAHILSNGVTTLRSRREALEPFLNARGEVRLAALLESKDFVLTAASGRSYGALVDAALEAGEARGKVRRFASPDIFASGLMELRNNTNTHGLLGYAIELNWNLMRFGLPDREFTFLPIEGEAALVPAHVGCTRTAEGERVIAAVNGLIRAGSLPEVARRTYAAWLPEDVRTVYLQRLRELK